MACFDDFEIKGVDSLLSVGDISDDLTSFVDNVQLNQMQAGVGSYQHVGRIVDWDCLTLRGIFEHEFKTTTSTHEVLANSVRMVVVWDKQPSGAAVPAFSLIFGHTVAGGSENVSFFDRIRYDVMDRYEILHDKICSFNPSMALERFGASTGTVAGHQQIPFDVSIDLTGLSTNYSGPDANAASINSGSLFVYFRALQSATWNKIILHGSSVARLLYSD